MKSRKVIVYEYLDQKILYIPSVNYYFGLEPESRLVNGEYFWNRTEIKKCLEKEAPEEYAVFSRTAIEKRETELNKYSEEEVRDDLAISQHTMCFHPSRHCNLQCRYCFGQSSYLEEGSMSMETIRRSIDYFIYEYAPYAIKYIFDFSGSGEPLLKFDLIKQTVEYCKQKRQEIGKAIEIMFCTNLTLMTPEMADYFEHESIVLLGTSVDGRKDVNDANRIYKSGKGTFEDIKKGLELFKNKKFGIAATVTPLNQNVDEIFDDLYHLPSVDCVSMRYIRDYSGSEYDFDNFNIDYLIGRYEKLCENIYREMELGNFDYILKLVNGADVFGILISQNLKKGGTASFRCEMGKNRIIVGASGDFYSCSVMMGSEEFKIGSLEKGVDPELVAKYWRRPKDFIHECNICDYNHICGGECYANSFLKYGDMFTVNPKNCDLIKRLNLLSYAFLERLKRTLPESYKEFVKLSFKVSNYTTTNSALWALVKWSSAIGAPFIYDDLMNHINPVDCTTDASTVLNYMKEKASDADSYQLERNITNEDFPRPGISVQKRSKDMGGLEYLIIYGVEDNKIIYEGLLTKGIRSLPVVDYIQQISNVVLI